MRKLLSILLTLALIIGIFPPIAKADESIRQSLNQHMLDNYAEKNFFPQAVKSKPFSIYKVHTIKDNLGKTTWEFAPGYEAKIPNYGEPYSFTNKFGEYRYIGYTPQGLPNGNPSHPFDDWTGGILEDRLWMDDPWTDDGVRNKIANQLGVSKDDVDKMFPKKLSIAIRSIPEIREKILWGLILNPYNGNFIIGKGPGQGINYPWEKKIIVYYPPTDETWGRGSMWHYSKYDGKLYYFNVWIPNEIPKNDELDFSISSNFPNILEVSDGDTLNIPVTVKYKGPLPTADHDPAFMNTNLGACYSDNAWSSSVYATNVGPLNAEEQTINATIPITVTGLSAYPNGRDLLISVNYPDATKNPNTMSNRNPEELKPGVVINDGKIRLTEMDAPERNQIPAKKDACTLSNKHLT